MFDRRKSRRTRENPPSPSIEANAGTDAGPSKSGEADMNMMSKIDLSASTSNLISLPFITEGVSKPFAELLRKFVAYKSEYEATPPNEAGEFADYDPDGLRQMIADHPAQTMGDVAAKVAMAMYELRGTTQDCSVTADRVIFDNETEFDDMSEALMLAAANDAAALSGREQAARASKQTGEWKRALADYQAKRAASDKLTDDDEAVDEAVDAYCEAMDDLIITVPAPDLEAVRLKLDLAFERSVGTVFYDKHYRAIADDLRRLASPQFGDGQLLAAFEQFRAASKEMSQAAAPLSKDEQDRIFALMDPADVALKNTKAATLPGVAAKLRRAYASIVQENWAEEAVFDDRSPEFDRGLAMADMYEQMLWGAIEDLQEIGSAAPHASGYPRDAREIIVDVECRLEQLGAALQVLSDGLHEDTCGNYGPVPKPLLGHLCQQWLLLEVIRRDLAATDARAVEADRILTSAQSA